MSTPENRSPGWAGLVLWGRLPTAAKLVAILAILLLPLGVVAAIASARATAEARAQRVQLVRTRAQADARALTVFLEQARLTLAMAAAQRPTLSCTQLDARLRAAGIDGAYAVRRPGTEACRRDGPVVRTANSLPTYRLLPDRGTLGIAASLGDATGYGEVTRARLARALPERPMSLDFVLAEQDRILHLRDDYERSLFQRTVSFRSPLAGTPLEARASAGANPASAAEIMSILLPILMWLAASVISWLVADRLLLRPILRLRDGVLRWQPGQDDLRLPRLDTPATEIRELADAFRRATETINARERDIEAGAGRQRLLVREVHHRVKNNLQVVSSLLNLHARGARTEEAAAAYASILRRVDALAVVHRNHFAELEDNRGVSLRTLLSELTANLRGNAAPGAERLAISIDADAMHVTQDVAVSVAFLITEVVEYAMLCAPLSAVEVTLRQLPGGARARLALRSDDLRGEVACEEVDARQFERVTVGLARQLRSALEHDASTGEYAVAIPVLAGAGGAG